MKSPMSLLATALAEVADHSAPEALETFRSPTEPKPTQRAGAVAGTATSWRLRFPADRGPWLVLDLGRRRNRPVLPGARRSDPTRPEARGAAPTARSAVCAEERRCR